MKLRNFFSNEKQFVKLKNLYKEDWNRNKGLFMYTRYLFSGVVFPCSSTQKFTEYFGVTITSKSQEKPFIQVKSVPYIISETLKNELKRIIKLKS